MNLRISQYRSRPTGDLPSALIEWCGWIYGQAVLAHNANPKMLTPEGEPTTWRDHCGMYERHLIEAAIRANIWEPN